MSKHYYWQDGSPSNPEVYDSKKVLYNKALRVILPLLFVFLFLPALHTKMYAEGSKDLYLNPDLDPNIDIDSILNVFFYSITII